jgi:hypothetical protein
MNPEDELIQCPYCFEYVELDIGFDTLGELVEDCQVCCRPLLITVELDASGRGRVAVRRAQ